METIPFPSQYKKTMIAKKKNVTIRLGQEIGRYQIGKITKFRVKESLKN